MRTLNFSFSISLSSHWKADFSIYLISKRNPSPSPCHLQHSVYNLSLSSEKKTHRKHSHEQIHLNSRTKAPSLFHKITMSRIQILTSAKTAICVSLLAYQSKQGSKSTLGDSREMQENCSVGFFFYDNGRADLLSVKTHQKYHTTFSSPQKILRANGLWPEVTEIRAKDFA